MSAIAKPAKTAKFDIIAVFMDNIANLNNGALEEVGTYMAKQSTEYRAQVTQRLAGLISSIASPRT